MVMPCSVNMFWKRALHTKCIDITSDTALGHGWYHITDSIRSRLASHHIYTDSIRLRLVSHHIYTQTALGYDRYLITYIQRQRYVTAGITSHIYTHTVLGHGWLSHHIYAQKALGYCWYYITYSIMSQLVSYTVQW